jgi:hypothetical protein
VRKTLIAILLAVALVVVPVGNALAADTDTVTVTATPGWVSIVNDPDDHDFGIVTAGTTPNTTTSWFTITNSSTVAMDVNIGCDGWASAGTAWIYGASGADQGQLNASAGTGAYDVTVPDSGSAQLMDAVATTTDPTWELELEAPSSFTFVDVQTTTITLTAAPD